MVSGLETGTITISQVINISNNLKNIFWDLCICNAQAVSWMIDRYDCSHSTGGIKQSTLKTLSEIMKNDITVDSIVSMSNKVWLYCV